MYCNKCGTTNPDNAKFCSSCGSKFGGGAEPAPKPKSNSNVLIIALAVLVLFAGIYKKNMDNQEEASSKSVPGIQMQTQPRIPVLTEPAYETLPPETENPYAGAIPSSWAAEDRKMGDGAYCGIMEMHSTVRNCNSVYLTLSAEGNHGASIEGNWNIDFRVGGQWKKITTVYYEGSGSEETFYIHFSSPTSFDAVSCYPTRKGNYSYNSLYYLSDADCN